MKFRRHEATNSPSNEKTREIRAQLARAFADMAGMLLDNIGLLGLTDEVVRTLDRSRVVNADRAKYISKRNLIGIMSLLTKLDCYTRFKAWVGDLVAVVR